MNAISVVNAEGKTEVLYEPQNHHLNDQCAFHLSNAPNLLALGTRGTGKSLQLRWDAIVRCLMFPNFKALLLRRKITDLRKSHLFFIRSEMKKLGGVFLETTMQARFPNGSVIQFCHCEKMTDVMDYLSSEWDWVGFDELSTFPLEMFLQISAAARAPESAPYVAVVRACSNTLGIGSAWMKQWFVDKVVDYALYPDYVPEDFEVQYAWLEGNKYINKKEYEKRLKNLPAHVRRSWLNLEFIVEGAYFTEFRKVERDEETDEERPWHCIQTMPTWRPSPEQPPKSILDISWIRIYRSVDWGYFPDPAVCHWHAVMPNGRKITFREETWRRTLAAEVAKHIKRITENMGITRVVETWCDPTMFVKDGSAPFSVAELFEINGVPLTPAQNDRELYGYAVHELLSNMIPDDRGREIPSWQILEPACPELVRTLPILQMDEHDPRKLADGPDHWVVSCAYFGMGGAPPSKDPVQPTIPRWMIPKRPSPVPHGYR